MNQKGYVITVERTKYFVELIKEKKKTVINGTRPNKTFIGLNIKLINDKK